MDHPAPRAPYQLHMDKLADTDDLPNLIPISFLYDYLPRLPAFLTASDWSVELPIAKNRAQLDPTWTNSVALHPKRAGMPYHTGLTTARQSRSWREAHTYAFELCELLAADQSYNDAKLAKGGTLSSIAQKELRKPELERYVISAVNLSPQSDGERLSLIACGIILVVTFDDSWEEAATEDVAAITRDFIDRMRGRKLENASLDSPLACRLNEIVSRCQQCDERTNTDGGRDFIDTMLEWVTHTQPEARFQTPHEYLEYRWMDAANAWLVASCKFSIASPVSLKDPLLQRIIRLVGDHESIVNDIASFDKEIAAFESGTTAVLINLVQVMREACGLSTDDAKTNAFLLQLLKEQEIEKELLALKAKGDQISLEHWRFIDSLLAMIGGNCFYVVTTSRYGGEAARITKRRLTTLP